MRIAIPTIWFHRGQTVVSKILARALRELGHEVFIHARMGGVYGVSKREDGRWGWEPATLWPEYDLKPNLKEFIEKLREQKVDLVLFNEEYDWELVIAVRQASFGIATYMDYLHKDWDQRVLSYYDRILCSTKRSFNLMPARNRYYIGWGIHEDSVIRRPPEQRPYLFFENAGWLGINDRKGLGMLLGCFQQLLVVHPGLSGSLLIHTQVGLDGEKNSALLHGVDVMSGSMNQPGLYHMAQVYCYPAILDGLGLSLMEAIASDCSVICPDAPPWNEFVEHEKNGLLLPVIEQKQREDGIAFPEVFVDKKAFTDAMERMAYDEPLRTRLFYGAFSIREEKLGWENFKGRIKAALDGEK